MPPLPRLPVWTALRHYSSSKHFLANVSVKSRKGAVDLSDLEKKVGSLRHQIQLGTSILKTLYCLGSTPLLLRGLVQKLSDVHAETKGTPSSIR